MLRFAHVVSLFVALAFAFGLPVVFAIKRGLRGALWGAAACWLSLLLVFTTSVAMETGAAAAQDGPGIGVVLCFGWIFGLVYSLSVLAALRLFASLKRRLSSRRANEPA